MVNRRGVTLSLLSGQERLLFLQMEQLVADFLGPFIDEESDPGLAKVRLRLHSD